MLPPTPTHFHSLSPIPTHSYPLLPTPTHFHLLPSIPTNFHLFPPTLIYSHPLPSSTPTHSHQLPLSLNQLTLIFSFSHAFSPMFRPLLLILNLTLPCAVSLTHFQSLSKYSPNQPSPTHHLPFQSMFSPCVLRAYINFNVNLFFLLFSVWFQKQLITLGLTTTFA